MKFQQFYKKIIRKSKFFSYYWEKKYYKARKEKSIKKIIKTINKLDLYERKNIICPKINRVIWIKNNLLNSFLFSPKTNKAIEKNDFYNNFLRPGDWDMYKKDIFPDYLKIENEIGSIGFRTVVQLFEEGINFHNTDEYKAFKGKMNEKKLKNRFLKYKKLFKDIKNNGYKSQIELGESFKGRKIYDEIRIAIDRNGEFNYICSSGNHRLAIAKVLRIDEIPVIVDGIHKDFIKDSSQDLLVDINNALDKINLR
ncbi:hypothetical protein LJ207_02965 [Halanaerobium sp. Z-7514]|uniref:ParB/Sulfiredoxin domain-containing protein n=1 Tax=Halanaerobium polyolivorans TaxID=2886943 RepID=A0AAW4WWP8_9FIRM|nr:hypothetical protein [Halanaerobium polyolivorans]MCC3144281.1 hypothetical protein [Halanaerobium polyolivorans]